MKLNLKKLAALTSSLLVVACNSGGASGGDNAPTPNPSPTSTPINILPLQITQNIVPTLNKVAGHKIWYMIIKNPNSDSVLMNPWLGSASDVAQFSYDAKNVSPVNPTKFAMKYDGAIDGVSQDCLNYITNDINFPAGASCAFKFEAQWDINTNTQTNYKFTMSYAFKAIDGNYYILQQGCVEQPQYKEYCLNNNQNLQVNVMQVTQKANDLGGDTTNSFNLGQMFAGNIISSDGSILWEPSISKAITFSYLINYNPVSNTYNKVLNNTYNQFLSYLGSAISLNGSNYYALSLNQNGLMQNVQSIDSNLKWVTGLDGNIYGSNGSTGNIYLLNQNDNTISSIVNASGETLAGVSKDGNFLTMDANNVLYCRLASNGYLKSTLNMKGLFNLNFPILTNNYYSTYSKSNNYYSLDGVYSNNYLLYRIDIDNCQIVISNYLTFNGNLNKSFGISKLDNNGNNYINRISDYSNGFDGN
ncbi:MAG: hypothetical protein EKK57_02265 [Proteobacteria bacterium]|nr:MAG: hypothetical protein EKK57_02265 [Pseudomonadota bacterium]